MVFLADAAHGTGLIPADAGSTRMLTVTLDDDEIATLAADDSDLPIGMMTTSAPVRGVAAVASAAMDALQCGYVL